MPVDAVYYVYIDGDLASGTNSGGGDGTDDSDPSDSSNWTNAYQGLSDFLSNEPGMGNRLPSDLDDDVIIYCRDPDTSTSRCLIYNNFPSTVNRTVTMQAAPGEDHALVGGGSGANFNGNSGSTPTIECYDNQGNTWIFKKLSFSLQSGDGNDSAWEGGLGAILENCLFVDSSEWGVTAGNGNLYLKGCGFYNNTNDGIAASNIYAVSSVKVFNSTAMNNAYGYRVVTNATMTVYNGYSGNNVTEDYDDDSGPGTITLTDCRSSDSTEGTSTVTFSQAPTSGTEFTSTTSGSENAHISTSSGLLGLGTDQTGNGDWVFTDDLDIDGDTFADDLGADAPTVAVASSGQVIMITSWGF